MRLCVFPDAVARALCTRAQTPSVGLIIIGVITFIGSMIGCAGVHILRSPLICQFFSKCTRAMNDVENVPGH